MIVVDTSVIASLWVPNKMDKLAYAVLKKDNDWVTPLLWKSEFRNVLAVYLRNEILSFATILQIMQEAEELMKSSAYKVNSLDVLSLVNASNCSSYDCEFVALAKDLEISLVTFDKKLCKEFPKIAVHPSVFIR